MKTSVLDRLLTFVIPRYSESREKAYLALRALEALVEDQRRARQAEEARRMLGFSQEQPSDV